GAVLAVLAVIVSLAGPLRPWVRTLTARLSRAGDLQSLVETLRDDFGARERPVKALLERVAAAVASALRLDRCHAIELPAGAAAAGEGSGLELSRSFSSALAGRGGPLPADDSAFE